MSAFFFCCTTILMVLRGNSQLMAVLCSCQQRNVREFRRKNEVRWMLLGSPVYCLVTPQIVVVELLYCILSHTSSLPACVHLFVAVMLRFFALHDYDKSHSLDGIELSGALTSYYDYGMPDSPGTGDDSEQMSMEEKTAPLLLEEEVEAIVDRILKDHDADRNGYLTYAELMTNSDGIWNSLDMIDDLDDAGEDDYNFEDNEPDSLHNVG